MSESCVYRVRSLQKRHGSRFSLAVPELDICRNELVCLLGPTGSGKSTLLRILAAVTPPTNGAVEFCGRSIHDGSLGMHQRRRIAMVFQRPLLLHGTVRYNVEYGLRLRGERHGAERVRAVLGRLHLMEIAQQAAATLSVGQQQLVALARSLVVDPDVLLLDEPTANLDPAHVALVENVLSEERGRRPMSVVWATHNLFQARRVADRVMLLWEGACEEIASREDFFERPCSPRTREFLEGKLIC